MVRSTRSGKQTTTEQEFFLSFLPTKQTCFDTTVASLGLHSSKNQLPELLYSEMFHTAILLRLPPGSTTAKMRKRMFPLLHKNGC